LLRPPPQRVVAYIDGFNLYHGLRSKFGRRYLWLDLEALMRQHIRANQRLERVYYFTASVRDNAAALARQSQYLGALETHCRSVRTVMGRFQEKTVRCRKCGRQWKTYEEKETDLNIGLQLLDDAHYGGLDVALVVSADSDLCAVVRVVKKFDPRVRIIALFPPDRRSDELRQAVDGYRALSERDFRRSQLPESVRHIGRQITYTRPGTWR
jgi:uncharacterized LabA/DUF88 family protein